ncbi:MAG: hypothetical protein HN564_03560, partial [Flavobacteriales bacterium]|nr:hypothetical protein [Flavobacteriales bacterium]
MKKYILYSFLFLFSLININSYSQSCNQIYINMYDSSADGWNGNYLSIIDSAGSTVFTTTLDSSDAGIDSVCLFDDCYIISCGGGVNQTEVSWNLTDSNGIVLTSGGAPFSDSICFPIHVGCMDPYANNYDSSAVVDDGTCLFNCTPVTLNMYDSWGDGWNGNNFKLVNSYGNQIFISTLYVGSYGSDTVCIPDGCYTVTCDGGSFQAEVSWTLTDTNGVILLSGGAPYSGNTCFPIIAGCMNSLADNYNPTADIDDGSCSYSNCTDFTLNMFDSFGDGWNGNYFDLVGSNGATFFSTTLLTGSSGTESFCIPDDCFSIICTGGAYQIEISWNLIDSNGIIVRSGGAPYTGNICLPITYGCTDTNASNFDSIAEFNDGSCIYPSVSLSGIVTDISCYGQNDGYIVLIVTGGLAPYTYLWSNGSTNEDLLNLASDTFSVVVTDDLGQTAIASFNIVEPDSLYTNYIVVDASGSGVNDGAIYAYTFGGTLPYTYYWLSSFISDTTQHIVNIPAGNYTSYNLDNNGCFNFVSIVVGIDSSGSGCTDTLAVNYNSNATIDDGSCIYVGCTDTLAFNYDSLASIDDGSCIYNFIYGCTDPNSSNFNSLANTDDGSCCIDGCTDPNAFNYDSLATCDDGSCIPLVYGCTDPNAVNYYAGANMDDGSCIYAGCTDPNASNYNPNATIDDGSCIYFNCSDPFPSGLGLNWSTDTKAEISWDNMNDSSGCMVWKYYVRYRAVGDPSWTTKSAGVGN